MKQLKTSCYLLGLILLGACSSEPEEVVETEHTTEQDKIEDAILLDEAEEESEKPTDNLGALIQLFTSNEDEIPDSLVDVLELESNEYWVESYFEIENELSKEINHLFVSWMPGGATSEYTYWDYVFTHVNSDGEFIDQVSYYATNDFDYNIIQNEALLITNNFANYDFSGDVAENTGDSTRITKAYFFKPNEVLDFKECPKEDLPFYRNRIYARHGLIFKTPKYQKFFSDYDWYFPQLENVDDELTKPEKKLATYIKELEKYP